MVDLFYKINLPIDSTVMMVNTSSPLRIYDVYGSPVRTDRIAGLWKQDTQELVMDTFWNRRRDLMGMKIRISSLDVS